MFIRMSECVYKSSVKVIMREGYELFFFIVIGQERVKGNGEIMSGDDAQKGATGGVLNPWATGKDTAHVSTS